LHKKEQEGLEIRQRVTQLVVEEEDMVLKKTALALEHKAEVERLRNCHESYMEAEIRLAEAKSDVASLTERNKGIAQQLEDERRLVAEVEREAKLAKDAASKALEVCKATLAEEEDGPNKEHFHNVDTNMTMEELHHEIEAERSKLEFIHDGNQGALKEFESRQLTIQKLNDKIDEMGRRLEKVSRKVSEIRQLWEPELDKLVREISSAFAYNFEQIGCAGEVGVHKDEDFDLWAIEIKVKFR
jgi:structural maintenance of chromosomes protein 5